MRLIAIVVAALATASAAAAHQSGQAFRDCPECPGMMTVPAGTFLMGSPASEMDGDGPQRTVRIVQFALGKHEVTVDEFAAFVRETGHKMDGGCVIYVRNRKDKGSGLPSPFVKSPNADWRTPGFGQSDRHPVVCVNWHDATAYVAWLSKKTGRAYRLPSEAEWEYAARAGTITRYWWGDDVGRNNANCSACGSQWDGKGTAPVGSFAANHFGLHDMHGNASEWVEDCSNARYRGAPTDGTAYLVDGCISRSARGGSWLGPPRLIRSANRFFANAQGRRFTDGFRVARILK